MDVGQGIKMLQIQSPGSLVQMYLRMLLKMKRETQVNVIYQASLESQDK